MFELKYCPNCAEDGLPKLFLPNQKALYNVNDEPQPLFIPCPVCYEKIQLFIVARMAEEGIQKAAGGG